MKIKIVVDFGKMHHVYEEYWDGKPFLHAIGERVSHICQKGFWWKSNYETDEMTTKKRIVGLEITKITGKNIFVPPHHINFIEIIEIKKGD